MTYFHSTLNRMLRRLSGKEIALYIATNTETGKQVPVLVQDNEDGIVPIGLPFANPKELTTFMESHSIAGTNIEPNPVFDPWEEEKANREV